MSVDEILSGGVVRPVSEVTSWLGGAALGEVRITQGLVTESASGDPLGRLEVTLPASREWLPSHPGHPLAAYGQELIVRRGFALPTGETTGWEILGRYRVWSAIPEGGWLTVTADSIDVRLSTARWIVSTRTSGTFAAQARQICSGIVPIRIAMADRATQARTWEQQQSRRESLLELCDAWGAALRMIDGQLTIVPAPTPSTPTVTVSPASGLTAAEPEAITDQVPNVVVASSAPEDSTAPVSAMAAVRSGPRSWTGPYGQVVTFYASPLLTTMAQCEAAARTRLARLEAQAPDLRVTAVTDPRVRLDSVRRVVVPAEDTDAVVQVTSVTHALTPGREPGGFSGVVVSGRVRGEAR